MKSILFSCLTRGAVGLALMLGLMWLGGAALADPILPGYDLFSTPPGGAIFNPSHYGLGPDVNIPMQGRALGPGDTDTIVQRFGTLPPGGLGPIPAELVSLSLESIAPVPLGSSFFDIFVDLDPAQHSTGTVTVTTHGDPTGGTFDSFFDIFARATLTEVGNPSNVLLFNIHDTISSTDSLWSHFAPLGYPENATYPSGEFYPGATGGGPGIPSTRVGVNHTGPHPHTVPASPEPGSVILFLIGSVGLGFMRRRQS